MKIKALLGVAGRDYSLQKGGEYDMPDEIAKDLIRAGHAIELKTEERATVAPTEKAKHRREGNKGR